MALVTTRLELNVLDKSSHPSDVSTFAIKNSCPAIVTIPELVAPFIVDRATKQGRYKIIVAVDYPTGANFALQKLRGLSADAMAADGFDIVRSNSRTAVEVRNEVKAVTEFIKQVNPLAEIRWTLRAFDNPNRTEDYLKSIVEFPCNFIRVDQMLTRKGIDEVDHKKAFELIRKYLVTPIKLSCNIDSKIINSFISDRNVRFDVTLNQALTIMKSYQPPIPAPVIKQTIIDGEEVVGTLGQDVK